MDHKDAIGMEHKDAVGMDHKVAMGTDHKDSVAFLVHSTPGREAGKQITCQFTEYLLPENHFFQKKKGKMTSRPLCLEWPITTKRT